jgi:transcription elongation GreA/GreB family factor
LPICSAGGTRPPEFPLATLVTSGSFAHVIGLPGEPAMSRAFVKEGSENDALDSLPDRPISLERNLVTARGLRLIEGRVQAFRSELAAATAAADRTAIARASRELRYWAARLDSAELAEPPRGAEQVVFGTAVTLGLANGREVTYRIVGEDEAEPAAGRIAWTTPVARAVLGAEIGEERRVPAGRAEVLAIDGRPETATGA